MRYAVDWSAIGNGPVIPYAIPDVPTLNEQHNLASALSAVKRHERHIRNMRRRLGARRFKQVYGAAPG